MGSCFMFNYGESERVFAARGLGPRKGILPFIYEASPSNSGLEVSLKANQSLYYSWTETAAISVYIHDVSHNYRKLNRM